jgi:hypothetical protein
MLAKIFFAFLIPVPQTSLILLASCPMRGRFLEAILQRTERKLAGPGRPGAVDGLVAKGGAPGGAAPYVTGRARCLAARGGYVNPASKGATSLRPGASRRSIPSRGSRGTGKPRTLCAARTRGCGCLKIESRLSCPGRDAARSSSRSAASQNRDRPKRRRSRRPRLCSAPLRKCYALRCVRGTNRQGCPAATNVASTQHSTNF